MMIKEEQQYIVSYTTNIDAYLIRNEERGNV